MNSAELASHLNESTISAAWANNATALKAKYNEAFWVPELGMYRDNESTTLCPQDANSFAVVFNLTTPEQAASISDGLVKNWNELGPVSPELPDTITPFISGFEVGIGSVLPSLLLSLVSLQLQAHFLANQDNRAMELMRREWGYILYTNLSVQSTILEGFTANGSLRCV